MKKLRIWLLALTPLIYSLVIWPSKNEDMFINARLIFIILFFTIYPLIWAMSEPQIRLVHFARFFHKQPKYVYGFLIFIISCIISAIFSKNSGQAWFGSNSFQTGAFFTIACVILAIIYSKEKNIPQFGLKFSLIAISILTILEYLGFRPLSGIVDAYKTINTAYPATTIGYRGHLAGLLLIYSLLPIHWYRDNYTNWRFISLFLLSLTALSTTTNSSSLLSLAICLVLLYIFGKIGSKNILLIFTLVSISLIMIFPLKSLHRTLVGQGIVSSRITDKDIRSTVTLSTRLILWKSAYNMFLDRPLVGWGSQNFSLHWFNYLNKSDGDQLLKLELGIKPGQSFSRVGDSAAYKKDGKIEAGVIQYQSPHSFIFDILYSQGIVGVLLLTIGISALAREMFKDSGRHLILFLPTLAYLIYLSAWFIVVPVTPIAMMILGMQLSQLRSVKNAESNI